MFDKILKKITGLHCVFLFLFVLLGSAAVSEAKSGDNRVLKDVTAEEALDLIEMNADNNDFVILDVRTPDEFKEGHLDNAENIDFYTGLKRNEDVKKFNPEAFKEEVQNLDKNKIYLIYCSSGNRSEKSLKIMDEMGFTEVYNMLGGFKDWSSKGLPFVR